jgi:DNA repair protein RecO (recombination protein O)
MTLKYRTRGFIFKKAERGDSDRVFSVFTDDFGRLDIFAKAIRKVNSKLRGGIDVFFMSEVEFVQGKNKKTLTDAVAIKKFDNVSRDIEKFKIANGVGEILDNFIRGEEKDKDIFNLLNDVFIKLNDEGLKTKKYSLVYHYFLWNTLSLLGYRSEVNKCASCGEKLTPLDVYFSGKEGGVICKKCLGKDKFAKKINSDIVKILRIILLKDWQTLSRLIIEPTSQKLLSEVSENAISSFCPS